MISNIANSKYTAKICPDKCQEFGDWLKKYRQEVRGKEYSNFFKYFLQILTNIILFTCRITNYDIVEYFFYLGPVDLRLILDTP